MIEYTQKCLDAHMGLWAIEESWSDRFLTALSAGLLPQGESLPVTAKDPLGYDLRGGTAIIPVVGHMTKGGDSFGGHSTVMARRAIRKATADDAVNKIMLYVDSPGGHVNGTHELAMDFKRAGEVKATHAHIQDMGASAAYYIASQAHEITANSSAMVGNVGVRGSLTDSSKAANLQGLKIHLLSTGPFKAIGAPGTVVSDAQIAHMQGLIDGLFEMFVEAVQSGRNLTADQQEEVLSGKLFLARDALRLGLIDGIEDFQDIIPKEDIDMDEEKLATAIAAALAKSGLTAPQLAASAPVLEEVVEEESTDDRPYPKAAADTTEADNVSADLFQYNDGVEVGRTEGYSEGVSAARAEAIEILELCAIKGVGVRKAISTLEAGESPDVLRKAIYEAQAGEEGEELNAAIPSLTVVKDNQDITSDSIYSRRKAW